MIAIPAHMGNEDKVYADGLKKARISYMIADQAQVAIPSQSISLAAE